MTPPLQILILSDGKPGHENQSRGLAEAISRLTPARISVLALERRGFLPALLRPPALPPDFHRPDLVIAAGHRTHGALLGLSRRHDCPCVVMMKPTVPTCFFDLCLVPRHDYRSRLPGESVVLTRGALNRVPPPDERLRRGGLVLLGGPSSSHGWDTEAVVDAVRTVVDAGSDRPWRATDSRRTPEGTLDALREACPAIASYPHQGTGRDWMPERLAEASEVWVTEDSISMIYEALSSGARVGLLPTPRLKAKGRVARGIDQLVDDGYLTRFRDWNPMVDLPAPPEVLQESARCARIVLERHFPDRASTE